MNKKTEKEQKRQRNQQKMGNKQREMKADKDNSRKQSKTTMVKVKIVKEKAKKT